MIVYATPEDLADWDPTVSDQLTDPETQLRSAAFIIAKAVNESLYDGSTVITDPKRDATCAQVVAWFRAGVTPGSGGLSSDPIVKAKAIEGASIDYDTSLNASVTAFDKRTAIVEDLCQEAHDILYGAGILYVDLPVWSQTPDQGQFVNEFGVVGGNRGFSGTYWPY